MTRNNEREGRGAPLKLGDKFVLSPNTMNRYTSRRDYLVAALRPPAEVYLVLDLLLE